MKAIAPFIAAVLITLSTGLATSVRAQSADITGNQTTEADRHADAVQILINDGEYENAIARVEAAIRDHSKSERLQLQRGLALVQLNRLDDAVSHYTKLMKRFKNNPEPVNNLAMVYRLQKKYAKAINLFELVIKKFPDYAQAHENLGDTYIELASREYAKAIAISPVGELLESKVDASTRFAEIAASNTAAARRDALAKEARAEKAIRELAAIQKAEDDAARLAIEDPTERILGTLESWANAWSIRDSDLYIAHYSKDFVPQDGLSLGDWLAQRRSVISGSEYITLEIDDINLTRTAANQVIVTFNQSYESNLLKVATLKSLTLRRYDDNKWLIIREEARPPG